MDAIHISLVAEPIAMIGSFAVTNSLVTSLVASVIIIISFFIAGRAVAVLPRSRFAHAIEAGMELMYGMIEDVTHDRAKAIRLFPLLTTFFVFILVNNWLGLLPGVGSIVVHTHEGVVPLFRAASADLNTTLALALISVIVTHIYAIRELGIWQHMKKYISLNPIKLAVGMLEFVLEFAKVISFAFRLFGNIFAGEVLLIVMSMLVPFLGPVPFYFVELFVGIIQALVFTMLTLVFIEVASSQHSEKVVT